MTATRGIVTAAFGQRKYAEMSVDLALSVKAHSSLPVTLVIDSDILGSLGVKDRAVFDRIIVTALDDVKTVSNLFIRAKQEAIRKSPYQISLFLDADLLCRTDPSYLLAGIGVDDLRVFGRYHDAQSCGEVSHHGLLISQLLVNFQVQRYTYCSLAAFAFGTVAAARLDMLLDVHQGRVAAVAQRTGSPYNDEILLGVLGERASPSFFDVGKSTYQTLDITFRWSDDYAFLHPAPMRLREAVRVLGLVSMQRWQAKIRLSPSFFWFADILTRRAEQVGVSRYSAKFLRAVVDRVFLL